MFFQDNNKTTPSVPKYNGMEGEFFYKENISHKISEFLFLMWSTHNISIFINEQHVPNSNMEE
jgi:hypothetical protein